MPNSPSFANATPTQRDRNLAETVKLADMINSRVLSSMPNSNTANSKADDPDFRLAQFAVMKGYDKPPTTPKASRKTKAERPDQQDGKGDIESLEKPDQQDGKGYDSSSEESDYSKSLSSSSQHIVD